MPRSPRFDLPEAGVFHVTVRGVDGCDIVRDDADRFSFIRFVRLATRVAQWRLLVYCLMTNHAHLIVMTDRDALSRGMHALNFRYAQKFNERHGRRGHLFQDRFHAQVIRGEEHLGRACAYVLANPVRAGICDAQDAFRWLGGEWAGD